MIGRDAVAAESVLALADSTTRNRALLAASAALRARKDDILAANLLDMQAGKSAGLARAALDRLHLDAARVEGMARSVEEIAALPDPVGAVSAEWTRPNGLHIQRVRVPLGVIGIIYESRPNVTSDAGALCLKSGKLGDPARRQRKPPLEHGYSRDASSKGCATRVCQPRACNSCRRRTVPPSA